MATRAEIRNRARIRADQVKSKHPSEEEYDLIVDNCSRIVFHDLIAAGWPVKKSTTTVALTGAAAYTLAFTIHSITRVTIAYGGTVYELKRYDESEVSAMETTSNGLPTHYEYGVDLTTGPSISFYPVGSRGVTATVQYIADWAGFTTGDTQQWRGPFASDELIVTMSAAAGCRVEGQVADANALDTEYKLLWERVINQVNAVYGRDQARIRDVESRRWPSDPFDFDV